MEFMIDLIRGLAFLALYCLGLKIGTDHEHLQTMKWQNQAERLMDELTLLRCKLEPDDREKVYADFKHDKWEPVADDIVVGTIMHGSTARKENEK